MSIRQPLQQRKLFLLKLLLVWNDCPSEHLIYAFELSGLAVNLINEGVDAGAWVEQEVSLICLLQKSNSINCWSRTNGGQKLSNSHEDAEPPIEHRSEEHTSELQSL